MSRSRAAASPALLFDITLTAIVITFGLLFDHVVQAPAPASPPDYVQQAGATQAVAQALRGPTGRRPS